MRALNRVFKGRARGDQPTLPARVKRILKKYGATLLMPGPAGILRYGFQPNNYRESTGQTLAAADQQVGLVVDAAQSPGNNLANTANWIAGAGTLIAGGVATSTSVVAGVNIIQQDNIGVTSKMLEVTITVTVVAGSAVIRPGGVSGPAITATGTYTQRLQAGAADAFRVIAGASGFTGSIALSSISVRELPGIHASQSTSGFQPYLRQSGGVNSWQFDGVDDRLSLSAVPFQTQDVSFAVCAYNPTVSDATFRRLFEFGGNGTEIQLSAVNGGVNYSVKGDTGSQTSLTAGGTSPAGSSRVVSVVNTSLSSRYLRVDGVQHGPVNTFAVSDSTANVATLGNRAAGDRAFSGHKHLQIFGKGTTPPTEAELRTLERWAASLQGRTL